MIPAQLHNIHNILVVYWLNLLVSPNNAITLCNQTAEAELQDLNSGMYMHSCTIARVVYWLNLLVSPDDARLPVALTEFASYMKSMHNNEGHLFSEEYEV